MSARFGSLRWVGAAMVVLACWAVLGAVRADASDGGSPGPNPGPHLRRALVTQAATRERLRVLGDAATCDEARFVAYRRSDAEPDFADQWYVASQLWADAELLVAELPPPSVPVGVARVLVPTRAPWWTSSAAARNGRCHLDKGFIFLDRLWDHDDGGYHARSDVTGTRVERGPRYGDDNALAGLALLATMETTREEGLRVRYRHAARREADFLIESGLWDDTFGGGFWWNTDRGNTEEGKPAQTNALAALFFARLHAATGEELYRSWALRTLLWLDTILYDPERRLYRRAVRYEDAAERAGPPVIPPRYFNYDQGLAIEAQLSVAALDGDPGRLARARHVGAALHEAFWAQERGGYNLEADVEQVYTSYAAWTSLGHLALYEADGDRTWLTLAQANVEALTTALREPDGGHALRHYRCVDLIASGCESGDVTWVVDHTRDTAAQAWAQHLSVAIGRRLVDGRAGGPQDSEASTPPARGRSHPSAT